MSADNLIVDLIIAAFTVFGAVLFGVSLYVNAGER
jgi:phage shock protein PspC (stress-responsive transcriptional regulator)